MPKLKQKEKKSKRRIKCPCCNKDKKIHVCYYRNGTYYINKHHYLKYLKQQQEKKS